MELFLWIVSFVFCNMLFRSKFPLLAFCMYVRFKWKIEISKVTQCKIWWIKWKSCDKNIDKRKTSPAGVEQAKEKNGSCLKLLTEHCVTFLLPSFYLISPRCRSVSLLNRWWLAWPMMTQAVGEKGCQLKIGTVPSWRKIFYFGSCKWVVPCRNGLGTVPKLRDAVPNF